MQLMGGVGDERMLTVVGEKGREEKEESAEVEEEQEEHSE